MLFALTGRFRPDVEAERDARHEAFGEHIAQRSPRVRMAASIRDAAGARRGAFILLEAEDVAQAQRFLEASPYHQAGLYERVDIDLLEVEVGSLG